MRTIRKTTPVAYRDIVRELARQGSDGSRVGGMREQMFVALESPDPRQRWLLRDDDFNLAFALQESFAYWMGLNPGHVERYNTAMEGWMVDGELPGSAYGDRMRNTAGHDQIQRAVLQLREDPQTRRAVIAVNQPAVEDYDGGDVSCTVYLQPFLRDGELHMVADLRSQDMYWGYAYDAQNNQFIQELMAGVLGVDVGTYWHKMNSCHYYVKKEAEVLRSAEVGRAMSTPDMRLSGAHLGEAMRVLDDGLESARNGSTPLLMMDELASFGDAWADWLRLMTAYEQHRYHDSPGEARRVADDITIGWWRDWLLERVEAKQKRLLAD